MTIIVKTIQTERLMLRQWREEDFEASAQFWADAGNMAFVGGPIPREDAWRRMLYFIGHWQLRGFGFFVVVDSATGEMAGYCGAQRPMDKLEPELGWGVFPGFQGRGYATEAMHAVLGFAFSQLGWTTAISLIADDNLASRAVARKLGGSVERYTDIDGRCYGVYRHVIPRHNDSW
ncbi:GNAT family N-acetyltransferase [Ciceribacter ferrooxidans]|uniref:N-acetyltransferase n=1 Tax=Ciceribacter ferrooxidans TaxID=2509717 RepID=A0A4Q2U1T7_9HYPH|nr:GNAT family N-acetyltransferase [Ciceribacter ferrooxidans]RYC27849.1 N-acetyltransferase [Ciceribacter ferrooxidans]